MKTMSLPTDLWSVPWQALPSGVDDAELASSCQSAGVTSPLLQRLLGAAAASEVAHLPTGHDHMTYDIELPVGL